MAKRRRSSSVNCRSSATGITPSDSVLLSETLNHLLLLALHQPTIPADRLRVEVSARPFATMSWDEWDRGACVGRATEIGSGPRHIEAKLAGAVVQFPEGFKARVVERWIAPARWCLDRRTERRRSHHELCFHWRALISHARRPQNKSSVAAT